MLALALIGERVIERTFQDYPDRPRVRAFILKVVASLKDDNFVETKPQKYPDRPAIHADVYGIKNSDGPWYVKLHIEHGRVMVLSCHEPEFPLHCNNGTIVKALR